MIMFLLQPPSRLREPVRPVLAALLVLACLGLVGCGSSGSGHEAAALAAGAQGEDDAEPEEDAIPVRVASLQREPLSSLYTTSATLRSDKEASVIARTQGVIRQLLVEEGDLVQAGQPLAHLEDDEQKITLDQSHTVRETRLREFERAKDLFGQALLSEEEFENKRREAEEARHQEALAELALSRTLIRAPFAGVIVQRHLDVGATVSDGTEVYRLADLTPLYVDVNVPERHVLQLEPGKIVRLRGDATGEEYPAVIERVAPSVDPETGTVKVTMAVEAARDLRPGAFVRVSIVLETHQEALVVPRPALVAEGRRWYVFRLEEDGETVDKLEVRLGFEEGERVELLEVLSGDTLQPGAQVVVVGAPALTDGARVQVMDGEEEAGVAS
jgi:membrane fusion protein (multidrug efflux system)